MHRAFVCTEFILSCIAMKILVIRFSSIGDIVLTTPVVRCLRNTFPEAEIHYATKKSFTGILQHNPYINKIHVLDGKLMPLVKQLKTEQFDCVIDLHNNQRTWLIKLLLGVKSFSFNKLNFKKWLLVNFKVNRLPYVHIVDRYLATCKSLGVVNDGKGLDYFIAPNDEVDMNTLATQFTNGYVAWVIGAKQATKRYPTNKIITTLNNSGFPQMPVMLLGGPEDAANAEEIIKGYRGNMPIYNACGKYTLNQSASLVKQASVVITNDTGLMHIAAAYNKTIVSVWGNTVPQFGMYPYYGIGQNRNTTIQTDGLSCRPCSKLGYDKCPKGHFKCMNLISETMLAGAIEKAIAKA